MSAITLTDRLELPITGMTCASCANRIERKLNKLDGVTATVNYATETATVEHADSVAVEQLIAAVEAAGYQAALPTTAAADEEPVQQDQAVALRRRLIISSLLSIPVLLIAMIPALQFDNWQWLSLQLATPVVLWGAWPFHRAAWANLKHATATMDTLISVGTLSAWLWSLYALFIGDAGANGMRMAFTLIPSSGGGATEIYLETASIVTTFILAGRYFESRAKRRAGAALKALLELGAKDVSILDPGGSERRVPIEQLQVGQRFIVRPGEKVATDGTVEDGHSAIDLSMLTGESVPVEVGPGFEVAGATIGLHEKAHERLIASLEDLADEVSPERLSLLIELTLDGLNRMEYKSMKEWAQRTVAVAERIQDPLLQTAGLAAAARGFAFAGFPAQARPHRDRAAQLVDALPDAELARRLDAIVHLAGAELYLHQFDPALAHAQRALSVGRDTGQHQLFPVVFAILGVTWMLRGHLQPALDPLEGNVEAARLSGNAQTISWSLYGLSKVAIAAGDIERGMSAAQEAVDVGDDGKPSHHVAYAAFALADAHLLTGKPERGLPLLERAAGGPDMPLVADSWRAYFLELLTRCRLALGQRDAAQRAAALADDSADQVQLPLARAWADRASAAVVLDAGDAGAAANLAHRSAATADAAGAPLEAALSRTLAGQALAAAGERERATQELEQAAAALDAIGAHRYRDAAERELRQLGHHIHRRSQPPVGQGSGIDALTTRELEIARRIVDRQTNRQIAEALFLSRKTVETHIRNIFAKLGADSRVEVARIVERADRLSAART